MSPKTKVLYVDDDPINLFLFKKQFSFKYNVITVDNGNDGIGILRKNPDIKIVFSDLHMPQMNGLEFINTAKKEHPRKEYFLITSSDLTTEIQQALDANLISGYISKPINIDRVIEVVEIKTKVQF